MRNAPLICDQGAGFSPTGGTSEGVVSVPGISPAEGLPGDVSPGADSPLGTPRRIIDPMPKDLGGNGWGFRVALLPGVVDRIFPKDLGGSVSGLGALLGLGADELFGTELEAALGDDRFGSNCVGSFVFGNGMA